MRQITQKKYDKLEIVNGIKLCPAQTDYSNIRSFGEQASFGKRASFGEQASFGKQASFGAYASFGAWASFGEQARFGEGASFGKRASFGEQASFGKRASFGEQASFGAGCKAESIFWDKIYVPENLSVLGRIYPTEATRCYWRQRLVEEGIEIGNKCYAKIAAIIVPEIPRLLKLKKWIPVERWILESWRKK